MQIERPELAKTNWILIRFLDMDNSVYRKWLFQGRLSFAKGCILQILKTDCFRENSASSKECYIFKRNTYLNIFSCEKLCVKSNSLHCLQQCRFLQGMPCPEKMEQTRLFERNTAYFIFKQMFVSINVFFQEPLHLTNGICFFHSNLHFSTGLLNLCSRNAASFEAK